MKAEDLVTMGRRITCESDAYGFLEWARWRGRPTCPWCGARAVREVDPCDWNLVPLDGAGQAPERICDRCREPFSVLTGTALEGSRIAARTWVLVMLEIITTSDCIASYELERKYRVSASSAWFMLFRLRDTMRRHDGEMFPGLRSNHYWR